ncbi:MAG: alpha/beta fold hydrolase [Actinomycetota bacterium]
MATCVLVHGAFHGGWCWQPLLPHLEARGHRSVALDLPGHGADPRALETVTFEQTVDAVVEAVGAEPEPVWLVAHSLGGIVAAAAAGRVPDRIARLVFVTALVPLHGEAMQDLPQRPADDPVNGLVAPMGDLLLRIDAERAGEALFNECSPAVADWATARLEHEARANTVGRAFFPDGRFPAIPRTYVACGRDRTITLDRQERISARAGIADLRLLDADHSPFLSRPGELAALLEIRHH